MLPMYVTLSFSGIFTIGRIAYRREGVFFPSENALSAGKGGWECTAWAKYAIYDCLLVYIVLIVHYVNQSFFADQTLSVLF